MRDKRFQPARRVGGRLFGRLQMGKLRREARRLTFIIRPVTEVVLTAEQALPIVLINRLPEAVEAVQAGLQRPLPIVDSPWFGLWQGLCGQQTQVPGGGEQPVQIAQQKLVDMVPDELRDIFAPLIDEHHYSEEEKSIVKQADALCAYLKCLEELSAGNNEFLLAKGRLEKTLESRRSPEMDYFMRVFVPSFHLSLDEISQDSPL